MKLKAYISTVIAAMIVFIAGWITMGVVEVDPLSGSSTPYLLPGIASALIFIIFIIYFIPTTIKMLSLSIKRLLKFKEDKGLWKILTLAFGAGMTLLSGLIAIFAVVWTIFAIKDGLAGTNGGGFDGWLKSNYIAAKSFISGDGFAQFVTSSTPFGLLVTSFVFTLIWTGAGIGYEVLKKIFGGNPKWNQEKNQKNDDFTPQQPTSTQG